MGGCISCLISETCATFCSMLSTFAIVILLMLAAAVSNNYRFLGQAWKGDKENPQSNGAATRTILACAAVYACFLGLSMLCFMGHAAKRKIKPETGRRRAA